MIVAEGKPVEKILEMIAPYKKVSDRRLPRVCYGAA